MRFRGAAVVLLAVLTAIPGGTGSAATPRRLVAGWWAGDSARYRTTVIDALPAHPRVVNYYATWTSLLAGTAYNRAFVHAAAVDGVVTFIVLEPWDGTQGPPAADLLASIAAGSSDKALRAFGARIAAQGEPVWVTFAHEMNGGAWYPWNLHGSENATGKAGPATWIAAWNRVTGQVDAGAGTRRSLISWAWAPGGPVTTARMAVIRAYWSYGGQTVRNVSILGLDAYLCYWKHDGTCADTYAGKLAPTVAAVRALNPRLPLVIAETGIGGAPGNRSAQVTALLDAARNDGVAGVLWFNAHSFTLTPAEEAAWARGIQGG